MTQCGYNYQTNYFLSKITQREWSIDLTWLVTMKNGQFDDSVTRQVVNTCPNKENKQNILFTDSETKV